MALERAIAESFIASAEDKNHLLFRESGPLATLAPKIHLAYALGIIGPITRADLFSIVAIRNLFAHSRIPIKFEEASIKSKCLSLKTITEYQKLGIYRLKELPFSDSDPRATFVNTCLALSLHVEIMRKIRPDGSFHISVNLRKPDLP